MRNAAYIDYATNGSSALARQNTTRFVVIDGGLSADAPRAPRRTQAFVDEAAWEFEEARSLSLGQRVALMVVAAAVIVALGFVSLFMSDAAAAAAASAYQGAELTEITVHSGDTLWGIAEEHAVDGVDTATLVELIRQENSLESANLMIGQRIVVPAAHA